jgi:hypothetical protein
VFYTCFCSATLDKGLSEKEKLEVQLPRTLKQAKGGREAM